MDNILFIPGIANPVSEIRQLLFGQGQPGGSWIPSLSSAMIAANSFGSGVTDILDLSGNNNPFSQATPASRGAWFREPKTGRRNLVLENSDVTDGVVSGTPGTGPSGWTAASVVGSPVITLTAEGLRVQAAPTERRSFSQTINVAANTTYAFTAICDIQAVTNIHQCFEANLPPAGTTITKFQDGNALTTFQSVSTGTNSELRLVVAVGATAGTLRINFGAGVSSAEGNSPDITFKRLQFEIGTTRSAYQNVTTAFDVTEAGQRDCYGVRADGIDDGYSTAGNVDFSATDAVTIFAAMRKVGTTSATFCELSAQADINNGAFYLRAPLSSTDSYDVLSRGTANARLVPTAFPSPITNILTAQFRISTDFANLRVDGTSVLSVSTDQGSGNYGNYPLFLMARNNTTSRFNGDLYALIVAGGSYPLSTIQRVERLLSRITPTVNL
jgi:hypothetical protein